MQICFFNDTATTEIYTLSLHDALPICLPVAGEPRPRMSGAATNGGRPRPVESSRKDGVHPGRTSGVPWRSEEHPSEIQSRQYLVCRLLFGKKYTSLASLLPLALSYCRL